MGVHQQGRYFSKHALDDIILQKLLGFPFSVSNWSNYGGICFLIERNETFHEYRCLLKTESTHTSF